MSYENIQLPVHNHHPYSPQSTEAFLLKWDTGQRPMKKGMSANQSFFHCTHVIFPWTSFPIITPEGSLLLCSRADFHSSKTLKNMSVAAWLYDYITELEQGWLLIETDKEEAGHIK